MPYCHTICTQKGSNSAATASLSDNCAALSDSDDRTENGGPLVEAPFYVVMTVVWGFWISCFLEKSLHRNQQSANPAFGC